MTTTRTMPRLVVVGAALALIVAACGGGASTAPTEGPAGYDLYEAPQELLDAAKADGGLTTIALPHDWCNYGETISTYESKFGIDINELDPNAGSGDEIEACFWNRPQEYYTGDWKGTKFLDGGILYTQFSHFIDLLYWLLGDVAEVKGFSKTFQHRLHMELEDTGVATIRMENGAIGTINFTINSFEKNTEGSFTVFGEKGTAKIGGQYLNTLEWFHTEQGNKPKITTHSEPNNYGFYQGSMSNHEQVYKDLAASLDGNGNLLEAKDAVKTIEIIEKIYKAIS